jgi:hypothetical protein
VTAGFVLVLASIVALTISVLLLRRVVGPRSGDEFICAEDNCWQEDDVLAAEVAERIFNPEDSEFVAGETSQRFTRKFRHERTALALDWLRLVRRHVVRVFRDHRRAARGNSEVAPVDEFRLVFEFLLFQVTSGILYCLIWVNGPLHTARLLGWSLDLAWKFRKIAESVMPGNASAAGSTKLDRM